MSGWHFSLAIWDEPHMRRSRETHWCAVGDRWSVIYPVDTEPVVIAKLLAEISDTMMARFAATQNLTIEEARAEYLVLCRQEDRTGPYHDRTRAGNWFGVINRDISHPENYRCSWVDLQRGWVAPKESHSTAR